MAHVHTFGQVAPAAAGIIQSVYILCQLREFSSDPFKLGRNVMLCHRVRISCRLLSQSRSPHI